jgi:hypothetical protein
MVSFRASSSALVRAGVAVVALLLTAGCGGSKPPSDQRVIRELEQSETPTRAQEEEARERPLASRYATQLEAVCRRFEGPLVSLGSVEPTSRVRQAAIASSRRLSSRFLSEARKIAPPKGAKPQATSLLDALEEELLKHIAFEEALGKHSLLGVEDHGAEAREALRVYERKRRRAHIAACGF